MLTQRTVLLAPEAVNPFFGRSNVCMPLGHQR